MSTVAVIILTYNEEENVAQAINSVIGWADEIFVLDSYSHDKTIEIIKTRFSGKCHIVQNKFSGYSEQRNFAIQKLPIKSEWIFFLDADELVSDELKSSIRANVNNSAFNGYFISRKMIWMGKWLKRGGYYPIWILRLFRRGYGKCAIRSLNEHILVDGKVSKLKGDLIHKDMKPFKCWLEKHIQYAEKEAYELFAKHESNEDIQSRLWGNAPERKRWLRKNIWEKFPPLIRPFFLFIWKYIFQGAFLDGKEAFIYHFMHSLWYPLCIDINYLESSKKR